MCLTLCLQNPVRFIDNFRTNITRQLIILKLCINLLQNTYLLKLSTNKRPCILQRMQIINENPVDKTNMTLTWRAKSSLFTFVLLCLMRYYAIMSYCRYFVEVGPSHYQPCYWRWQSWTATRLWPRLDPGNDGPLVAGKARHTTIALVHPPNY